MTNGNEDRQGDYVGKVVSRSGVEYLVYFNPEFKSYTLYATDRSGISYVMPEMPKPSFEEPSHDGKEGIP